MNLCAFKYNILGGFLFFNLKAKLENTHVHGERDREIKRDRRKDSLIVCLSMNEKDKEKGDKKERQTRKKISTIDVYIRV